MSDAKRVMTKNPLNAETNVHYLRSWITPNSVFFSRNQSRIMTEPIDIAKHVAFEGFDKSGRSSGIDFIRSIPIEKAMASTMLAHEMNGEPLPEAHGYPLRGLPLGWAGASCVKWLRQITVMDRPFEGYFMDKAYRVFQEGQQLTDGEPVTAIPLKSVIVQPQDGQEMPRGKFVILGAAYGGEEHSIKVTIV